MENRMTDDLERRRVPRFKHPYEAYEAQIQASWELANTLPEEDEEDKIAAAVDPKHYFIIPPEAYERFPEGLQYQHIMYYVLANHEPRVANLLAQVFKYLLRGGKKDDVEQEFRKAKWYLDFMLEEAIPYVKTFYTDADLYDEDQTQER